MTFAFDEQFTMFDITPVENQFILEQLPEAKGDYVKVYLYGLLHCYHPREDVTPDSMSRDLNIPKDEILAAFRYWERHGAVRRISDHPPVWQYINFKQRSSSSFIEVDPEYAEFCKSLESSFKGRREFSGSEMAAIYEWKEGNMQLPAEVIIMLLKHMERTRGKHFKIKDAERLAMKLADQNARSEGEAAIVLSRDEEATRGMQEILTKMGKRYSPSDGNISLYVKWTQTWGFTQKAIEAACDKMQTSDPNLSILDKILQDAHEAGKTGDGKELNKKDVEESIVRHNNINEIMRKLGRSGRITDYRNRIYDEMMAMYPQDIILLGAEECGRKNKDLAALQQLLKSWKERGFTTEEQVRKHIGIFRDREDFLTKVRARWSSWEKDPGEHHIEMLTRWEDTLGISRELILKAADYATEVRRPMAYLDVLITRYAEQGIRTPEAAEQDRLQHLEQYKEMARKTSEKKNPAANYSQRDYSGEQDAAMERLMNWNGTKDDA